MNVWTKFTDNLSENNLCKSEQINDTVKELYYKHKIVANQFLSNLPENDSTKKKYYVYIWQTLDSKIFYVGKGTASRYKHILSEIEKYKNGKKNTRFEQYSMLQDDFGIEHKIILSSLTEYEAVIFEECLKLEYIEKGEVLLNVEGIPDKYLPDGWGRLFSEEPTIDVSPFYKRYYGIHETHFDELDLKALKRCYIHKYGIHPSMENEISSNANIINSWVKLIEGKAYKSISTRTESVIVMGLLSTKTYLNYRDNGLKIFNGNEVLSLIKSQVSTSKIDQLANSIPSGEENLQAERLLNLRNSIMNIIKDNGIATENINIENDTLYCWGYYCFNFSVYKKSERYKISIPNEKIEDIDEPLFSHTSNWQGHYYCTSLNDVKRIEKSIIKAVKYDLSNSKNRLMF